MTSRAPRGGSAASGFTHGLLVAVVTLLAIGLAAVLLTVPVLIGWNNGVIGVAQAIHLHTIPSKLNFLNALGVSFFIGTISRVFNRLNTNLKAKDD